MYVCETRDPSVEVCVEITRSMCVDALEDTVGRDRVSDFCDYLINALVWIVYYAKRVAG
jgi:hypothetical protein